MEYVGSPLVGLLLDVRVFHDSIKYILRYIYNKNEQDSSVSKIGFGRRNHFMIRKYKVDDISRIEGQSFN